MTVNVATTERRIATVASRIEHDGEIYEADDLVRLTKREFEPLRRGGALVEQSWDSLTEET